MSHMLEALVEWLVHKLPRRWLILFVLSLVIGTMLALTFFLARRA
ncbi:MAG TPA: hypothetical protein VEZ41_04830 [Allosphingosinicella sp.]|nr:hypothetical protein [Allosphingosinicella sp.]